MGNREGIEEDAFHRVKPDPEPVEPCEREGYLGCRGRSNSAVLEDFDVVGSHGEKVENVSFSEAWKKQG